MRANPQMLMRGFVKLVAAVVAALVGGAGIGIGLAELTGNRDKSSTPPAVTGSGTTDEATPVSASATRTATMPRGTATTLDTRITPAETAAERNVGAATSRGRLRIDVLSTIAHPVTTPAGATAQRARISVHARVTNNTGRVVMPTPVLLVGDAGVQFRPGSSSAADALLAPLDPGAVADGTLRFDTEGVISGTRIAAPVRLRIARKTLILMPVVGSASASG